MVILNEKPRYPNVVDKLFIDKGTPSEIAYLDKVYQNFSSYADSYQYGALKLIDESLEKDNKDKNYLIYPIVFLIRHYMELRLKEIIIGLNYCQIQDNTIPHGHKLDCLWEQLKKKYEAIGERINTKEFIALDNLVKEFSSIDPISMAFRYPVDKKGNSIQKLEFINIMNLKETFIRIVFVLDGIAMQINDYTDFTESMMREAYEDYF